MDSPLVTVMIPVFNGLETLPVAINSLKAQTYSNWFAIIVNDGSVDGTKEYLNTLVDKRIRVIHLDQNLGRPNARQVALNNAKGKYLAFLDADDFYHPNKLRIQVEYMEANSDISLLGCGMGSFNSIEEGLLRVRGVKKIKSEIFKPGDEVKVVHAASMIRLEYAKEINYDLRLKFAQDMDFLTRYLVGKKYANCESVLYYYSEFQSVSAMKVIRTRWYGLIRRTNYFKFSPLKTIRSMFVLLLKWLITTLLIPIVGVKFFLNLRGEEPDNSMKMEFDNAIQKINLNYVS